MKLTIYSITAEEMLRATKDERMIKSIKLTNADIQDGVTLFDVVLELNDRIFSVFNKFEASAEYMVISINNGGQIELAIDQFTKVTLE